MKKDLLKHLSLAGLVVLAILVLGYRFWYPPDPYFDEVHYVKFMRALLYENTYNGFASQHPPLWHLLMALAVEIFGDQAFSWRLVSLLAHAGVVILVFKIALQLTRNRAVAWFSTLLLFADCVSLTQARVAMMNSTMLLFVLLSIFYFLKAFEGTSSYDRAALRLSGIFWACALITKLVSLSLLFLFVPFLLLELKKRPAERLWILQDIGLYFAAFPILLTITAFSFVPFLKDRSLADIWNIQVYNLNYNATTVNQTHGYSSRWWSWPLMLRPISYYFNAINWNTPAASCETILAIGNPVLFWTMPLAIFHVLWEALKNRSRMHAFILLGFLSQWMTFGLAQRLQFFHYIYQSMPFVVMAVALLLWEIRTWGRGGRIFVVVYLVAVAAMFVYWYPLLTGITISREFFYQHMWFPRWI